MWILLASQERAFSVPGSNPRSYIAFSCHVSLVSFSLWHFPFFPGLSRPYHLRRVLIRWFVECTPIWEHFIFWLLDWGFSFLSEYHRSGMPLSEHNVSRYIMSIRLISGDINLDFLVEAVSSAFLPCNATSFTNVINEIPGEIIWDSANMLFLLNFSPQKLKLTLAHICGFACNNSYYSVLMVIFYFPCSFHSY